ncbi:MAG: UDP-N-acetylmuramoylalanine--D-glutamate ligase [Chlamydiia bacterium]|nr:UDP-N-acetylmuramoylalanine--D-glutamate ligase [Chlamydiia bacterium]
MKALIIGAGKSGVAAADFLFRSGYHITLVDKHPRHGLKYWVMRDDIHIEHFVYDLVVVSPGIPPSHPLYRRALEEKKEVIGEAELAFRHIKSKVIGVSGTNGKTTCVSLFDAVLQQAKKRSFALGNIGIPLTQATQELENDDFVVAELSSFQLETMYSKVLDCAVLLNVTPDHMDRYDSFESYLQQKLKMIELTREGGEAFVDERVFHSYPHLMPKRASIPFSSHELERIYPELANEIRRRDLGLLEKGLLAFHVLKKYGVQFEHVVAAVEGFKKPDHRLEFVDEIEKVGYYNDSKATNVQSVVFAVKQIQRPIILLAGGVHKGSRYDVWKKSFAHRVRKVLVFGQAAPLINDDIGQEVDVEFASGMEDALERARKQARDGDVVLLSPGCSSFDQFKNYEERGSVFRKQVERFRNETKRNDSHCSYH